MTLILDGLAVYRLWRLAAKDTILDRPRAAFESWAWQHRRDYSQGSRLMVLISCGFCLGFWISVAAVAAERYVPRVWTVARAILATSALAGLIAVIEAKVED